jgi:predicted SAM-dependent methyltransferase
VSGLRSALRASTPETVRRVYRRVRRRIRWIRLRWSTAALAPIGAPAVDGFDRALRRCTDVVGVRRALSGPRRLEIGSGHRPREGYLHVDIDPDVPGTDLLVAGVRLPVPDAWADEVLSVHMIEHVPPRDLERLLREWHRVLAPGGVARIHTPNGTTLARTLVSGGPFWAVQSAVFGYGPHPRDLHGPADLGVRGDHRVLFTFDTLRTLLERAGFGDVRDVTGDDPCHHLVDWAGYVDRVCLEVEAVRAR